MLNKGIYIGCVIFLLLSIVYPMYNCTPKTSEEELIAKAKKIHDRVLTLDSHVDIEVSFITPEFYQGNRHEKLFSYSGMEKGGMDAVFFSVYTAQGPRSTSDYEKAYKNAIDKFDRIHTTIQKEYADRIGLAFHADEVHKLYKQGKKICIIGVENGYPLGMNLANLKKFYDLGCRYITLCHNGHNQICDSHQNEGGPASEHNGVSPFGEKVIAEMNRLGVMVDISHLSKKSMLDVIKLSKAPVMASHSCARALCDVTRNLDDEQLQALKENGGVVHLVAINMFVKSNPPATVKDFVNHIDYVVKLIGIDHVGISSDFYETPYCIEGWEDVSKTFNITLELVRRGYSEADIAKIWSGNLLRVWREVEKTAKKEQIKGTA